MTLSIALPRLDSPLNIVSYLVLVTGLFAVIYYIERAIYNAYFSPLAQFPGPFLRRISDLPYFWDLYCGNGPQQMLELHDLFGPVVRVAPNELTFISAAAFRDIYGHGKNGQPHLRKDKRYYSGMREPTLLVSDDGYHSYLRRLLSHGFSDSALRRQEVVLQRIVDGLVGKLREQSHGGREPVDLVDWYMYFAFDVASYLTYGESSECLHKPDLHSWVTAIRNLGRPMAFAQAAQRLPALLRYPFMAMCLSRGSIRDYRNVFATSEVTIQRRLKASPLVPDFMAKLIHVYEDGKMTMRQLNSNATFLMAAGSETIASLLAHATFQLITHPAALQKATDEIRTRFKSSDEINVVEVNRCKYLLACLDEALRIRAPSPATHPRYAHASGAVIDGLHVPGDTAVGVPIYAACMSATNFSDPEKFVPERWTGEDATYANDVREAAKVFSVGPHDCLGRNLAYVEMRLVMASILWHFDLEKAFPENWADQKVFLVWEKPPLPVTLQPRVVGDK